MDVATNVEVGSKLEDALQCIEDGLVVMIFDTVSEDELFVSGYLKSETPAKLFEMYPNLHGKTVVSAEFIDVGVLEMVV